MARVIIGMDPHKRSATIEIIDERERVLDRGRFDTSTSGYQQMLRQARRHPDRVWAVEGCGGTGHHLAQRLLADGEPVLDVPAKLSARVRLLDTGQNRKTDPIDAHSVAVAALRATPGQAGGVRPIAIDETTAVLGLLADRRDLLGRQRTDAVNRLHRHLTELIPGGAAKGLSTTQARTLLGTVRPRDLPGRTRRRLAAELITELAVIDKKIKTADTELTDAVKATGSTLPNLYGIGPSNAARLLADIADINRFPTRGHFATYNGTAPRDASSGQQQRHRLSRAGNRRLNRVLHIMAVTQLRRDTEGRAYYQRKLAAGKTPMEAIRALKRRLSDIVYKQMTRDHKTTTTTGTPPTATTGPAGQPGTTPQSSVADQIPTADTSDQSHTGPATPHPKTPTPDTP